MGDRVSIQFQNGDDKSVVLFSHWDGMELASSAKNYVKILDQEIAALQANQKSMFPIHRKEPETVMVDFIVQYVRARMSTREKSRVTSNYYLGATAGDGDNSDNGHFIIDLETAEIITDKGVRL